MTKREILIQESKRLSEVKKVLDRMQHEHPLLKEAFRDILKVGANLQSQILILSREENAVKREAAHKEE
jgi:hypothetical protein